MSYTIEPIPVINFVDDSTMHLPRFQRRATWGKEQNFELCISIFQDYPVGVVIVNMQQRDSWLLDGRQRRTALTQMRANPVLVYDWAKKYLGFKPTEDVSDLRQKYWDKVEKYLQKEEKEDASKEVDDVSDYGDEEIENSFDKERQRAGLNTLLEMILMVHQVKSGKSQWERVFDFTNYIEKLTYAPAKLGGVVQPALLRKYLVEIGKENLSTMTADSFVEYYENTMTVRTGQRAKFVSCVEKNWNYIKNSIETIKNSEKIFQDARIGLIKLTNVSDLDAQNIFSRINKGGTQLKAEELLSAKPFWNEKVNIADADLKEKVKELYTKLGVETPSNIVRWDLAATLLPRINDNRLLFDEYKGEALDMEQVTLGFKLVSSAFVGGMSGKAVNDLEKKSINWETDIDSLIDDVNTVVEILMSDGFFKYLRSWLKPISKLLGNAIVLEFITIMILDWKSKGSPRVSSSEYKAVIKDAKILFDRLVYEYATKSWRGSGDSKMATDINNWQNRLEPVTQANWDSLIEGLIKGEYNGEPVTQKIQTPILYYFYSLRNICPPMGILNMSIDVDHLYPQEKFKNNKMVNERMKDSLINLSLLPKKENISKSSKALNEITDSWLKDMIKTYIGIDQSEYDKYSDISNLDDLASLRGSLFKEVFSISRESVLSN